MTEQTNIVAVNTVTVAPIVLNPEPDHKMTNLPAAPGSPAPTAQETKKGCFLPAPSVPTQVDPSGVRFDFNFGCRVVVPEQPGGEWEVQLRDFSCDVNLFSTKLVAGNVTSTKTFYVPFEIVVARAGKEVLRHRMDLRGRKVLIQFPVGTLGDLMGWFPYATRFQAVHDCELTVSMGAAIIELFKDEYPNIRFQTPEQVDTSEYYATYNIGLFFGDKDFKHQPFDFRYVGLHRTAGFILGVDPKEFAPRLAIKDDTRPIPEPYVVIATQSTTQSKYWNNLDGWRETIKFLKANGYRVICIDQKPVHGAGNTWNQIPHGCEDETGNRPLSERARWIKHADFFIGLSSGLSWLAWATGVPIVMISGFTHPFNEFDTPYRVINPHTCNSCWNDQHVMFDHHDFMWCPRHKGTAQQFECTRLIQPKQVIDTIRCIPAFKERAAAHAATVAWSNASAGAVASLGNTSDSPKLASV